MESKLRWVDHAADPAAWATALGVSERACELLIRSPFIDLHVDLEVPVRTIGYDPTRRHGPWRRVVPVAACCVSTAYTSCRRPCLSSYWPR